MEGEGIFGNMDADFLASNGEGSFDDLGGFDPITGEMFETKKSEEKTGEEPELKKEIDFVEDSAEQSEDVEEQEEAEQQDEEETDENAPDSEESPSSPLTSLTSALREDGVLSSLSDEEFANIKSGGDLMNAIKKQIQQNELAGLNDDQKEYLKAMSLGIPDATYRQVKHSADQLAKIDPATLDGDDALDFRRQVLIQDFLSKGFDQEDAEKYAGRSIDLGEDVTDSKKALARLQAAESKKVTDAIAKAEADQKAAEEKYNTRINEIKTKVLGTKEILPNIKINEATQNKVFDLMTKTAGYDARNNPVNAVVKNMIEDQDYLIKLNYLHVLTDGFTNWSELTGTVGSSAVNKLDKALAAQDAKIKAGTAEKHSGPKGQGAAIINALDGFL